MRNRRLGIALGLLAVCLTPLGCADSRRRSDEQTPMQPRAGADAAVPDAVEDEVRAQVTANGVPVQQQPQQSQPPEQPLQDQPAQLPPFFSLEPELAEQLQPLQDEDFSTQAEEVARESCGWLFSIAAHTTSMLPGPTANSSAQFDIAVDAVRVFDDMGRLLLMDERAPNAGGLPAWRRTRIDYDAQGRVQRVRRGEAAMAPLGDDFPWGTVIEFEYAQDGSFEARMATTEVVPTDFERPIPGQQIGICDRMEFDAQQRLIASHWGCGEQTELGRSYEYDAQGELSRVTGLGFNDARVADRRFGELDQWEIVWDRSTAGQVTVTWSEIDGRTDMQRIVDQRLVRYLDAQGRVARSELDFEGDGDVDERFEYTYADDSAQQPQSEAFDFLADGVIDIFHGRSVSEDVEQRELRNMGQLGEVVDYAASVAGHFGSRGNRYFPRSQSLSEWTLRRAQSGLLLDGEMTMRAFHYLGHEVQVELTQTQTLAAEGYAELVELTQRELPEPELGGLDGESTIHCELVPACEARPAQLPAAELLGCHTDTQLDGLQQPLMAEPPDPYLPPPFHLVAAMRRRVVHATSFVPSPPSVRELVAY